MKKKKMKMKNGQMDGGKDVKSRRSAPLPADWSRLRRRILRRDMGVCYICGRPGANSVDHIRSVADGGSDDESNLAAVHARPCHERKTAAEANRHNPMTQSRKREAEPHPGYIRPGG